MGKGLKHTLLQVKHASTQQVYTERYSTTLSEKCKLKPAKMVVIKNGMSGSNEGVNWKTCVLLVGMQSTIVDIENSVEVPPKIKNRASM